MPSLHEQHGPLVVTIDSVAQPTVVVKDTIFYPTGPNQTAVTVQGPDVPSCVNTLAIFENCVTAPGNGFHWVNHFHAINGWNARFVGCNAIGPSGLSDPVSMNGFILDGSSIGVTLDGCRTSGVVTGVWIKGDSEGTKIRDLDAVGVMNGIVAWPDSGGGEPGLWITDSHINATQWGVYLRHRYQVYLRDVLIYAGDYFETTRNQPFYAFVAESCQEMDLVGVRVSHAGAEAAHKPLVPQTFTQVALDTVRGHVRQTVF